MYPHYYTTHSGHKSSRKNRFLTIPTTIAFKLSHNSLSTSSALKSTRKCSDSDDPNQNPNPYLNPNSSP